MTVTLTEVEQRLARVVAAERTRANRAAGVVDQQLSPEAAQQVELTGIGAELAYARLMNVYPDLTVAPRAGGADVWWAGLGVDVKGTERPHGRLLARPTKLTQDGVTVYALMTGPFPTYTFRGQVPASTLLQARHLMDLGHGPTYAMSQPELCA